MIWADFRRIFRGWRIYVAILLGTALILHPLLNEWKYRAGSTPMQLLSGPLGASDYTPFAVIFCVFPFADSFCEDYRSGFTLAIAQRTGKRYYAISRIVSVAMAGATASSVILLIPIFMCAFGAGQADNPQTIEFMQNTLWYRMGIVLVSNGWLLYLLRILSAALFGAVWSLVGLSVSTWIPNRYVTLILPFIIYQTLWFLLSGTSINPLSMLRGDSVKIPSFSFLVIYQLLWIAGNSAIAYRGICRRWSM